MEAAEVPVRVDALARWIERNGTAGSDPYDGLNSPFAPLAGLGGRWGRIAFLQAVRRSRVVRAAARVPPAVNPKGLALLAEAYLDLLAARGDPAWAGRARAVLDELETRAVPCREAVGWGYPFDWAARAFFVPRNTPSVVVTATAARALLAGARALAEPHRLDLARRAACLVTDELQRTESDRGVCFSYTPVDRSCVWNASLMGAAVVLEVAAETGGLAGPAATLAHRAVDRVVAEQRPDGSWAYGAAPHHGWTDGHHTGFVLRDLAAVRTLAGRSDLDGPIARGLGFYLAHLLAPDGRPLHRLDRPWPADVHAAAEAILVLADPRLGPGIPGARAGALAVAGWIERHLGRPDGAFGYLWSPQRRDLTPHLRWGQAWMLRALARLERGLRQDGYNPAFHDAGGP